MKTTVELLPTPRMFRCNHGTNAQTPCISCGEQPIYDPEQEAPAVAMAPDKKEVFFVAEPDPIEWPKHYNQGEIQMSDYVIDQKLGWCSGNVVKYVVRSRHKGKRLEDLKKAKWYLDKLIGIIENGGEE